MNINQVTIVGNVTRDPELRYTPAGTAFSGFGVAVNKRWFDKQSNDWKESTSFIDVVVWGQQAENVAESCPKGCRVVVVGELKQRSWETDDGSKRSKVEVTASVVAPSLEWASAIVSKNEKREPGQNGSAAEEVPVSAYSEEEF